MWLGYCIANWAKTEEVLFHVFWKCLQAPQDHAAIVYYRLNTVSARLDLTNELVLSVLPKHKSGKQPHLSAREWATIRNEIYSHLAMRRQIAHQPVAIRDERFVIQEDSGGFGEVYGEAWAELHKSKGETLRKNSKDGSKPLRLRDLKRHRSEMERMRWSLYKFATEILPEQLQAHVEQRRRAQSQSIPAEESGQ